MQASDCKINIERAVRQMNRAIRRGDANAAFTWMFIAERQLGMARKLIDLQGPRHRPWRKQGRP